MWCWMSLIKINQLLAEMIEKIDVKHRIALNFGLKEKEGIYSDFSDLVRI